MIFSMGDGVGGGAAGLLAGRGAGFSDVNPLIGFFNAIGVISLLSVRGLANQRRRLRLGGRREAAAFISLVGSGLGAPKSNFFLNRSTTAMNFIIIIGRRPLCFQAKDVQG
jgi:hypothetical protein